MAAQKASHGWYSHAASVRTSSRPMPSGSTEPSGYAAATVKSSVVS